MASDSKTEKKRYYNVAASEQFHAAVRGISGLEGQTMIEVCDTMFLKLAERRLERLKKGGNGKAAAK
jgi:hypothetical protein